MSILIVGSEGSMGRRYKAILSHLKVPYECVDKEHSSEVIQEKAWESNGIIIATPTETHTNLIMGLNKFKIPILCEKPFTKNMDELSLILEMTLGPLDMMFQYSKIYDPTSKGNSFYNYFRHGNDGLVWDCMQTIGLANGEVEVFEDSPVWTCQINGTSLDLFKMDSAYVEAVRSWLREPKGDRNWIRRMHEKTYIFEKEHGKDK